MCVDLPILDHNSWDNAFLTGYCQKAFKDMKQADLGQTQVKLEWPEVL